MLCRRGAADCCNRGWRSSSSRHGPKRLG
jgi:hypothetical protein